MLPGAGATTARGPAEHEGSVITHQLSPDTVASSGHHLCQPETAALQCPGTAVHQFDDRLSIKGHLEEVSQLSGLQLLAKLSPQWLGIAGSQQTGCFAGPSPLNEAPAESTPSLRRPRNTKLPLCAQRPQAFASSSYPHHHPQFCKRTPNRTRCQGKKIVSILSTEP